MNIDPVWKYRPYHRGTHQIIDCTSVDFELGINEDMIRSLVSCSLKYDIQHPTEVVPCAHRWLYIAIPCDGSERVLQVSTLKPSHMNFWDEQKSLLFLQQEFPDRYQEETIFPHGEEPDGQKNFW